YAPLSLENFIAEHDEQRFGSTPHKRQDCLYELRDLIDAHILNDFPSVEHLYQHLNSMDILHPEHLRPSWDSYFMVCHEHTMASLASRRSNCMKRRVGAVLVRENRVIATGDDASATLFQAAGVELRRHDPNTRLRISPNIDEGIQSPPMITGQAI
ncbi:hypothetical protein CVT24_011545, partial [Panaeolus cyanescens]